MSSSGPIKNSLETDMVAISCILMYFGMVICPAISATFLYGVLVGCTGLGCNKCDFFLISNLGRMDAGTQCKGNIILYIGSISWISKSINALYNSISTAGIPLYGTRLKHGSYQRVQKRDLLPKALLLVIISLTYIHPMPTIPFEGMFY